MTIYRSIDIEDAARRALSDHMTVYCAPLPANYDLPHILVQAAGGGTDTTASGRPTIDMFTVTLDARAETEAQAMEYIRTAAAILESTRSDGISYARVNSLYSWGVDPVRPDLAMCSAAMVITAHREKVTID